MAVSRPIDNGRKLEEWYSFEVAKRRFGWLCQTLNETGGEIGLGGSPERPSLFLLDSDVYIGPLEETISIETAKSRWSAMIIASGVLGTRFLIEGKRHPRAVVLPNPSSPHPALKFKRPQEATLQTVANRLEKLLDEIRQLHQSHASVSGRLEGSLDLVLNRFRELWRINNGYPAKLELH